jgi:hypothetical protein
MFNRIAAVTAAIVAAVFSMGALPANAATSNVRSFSIPGVYGIGAWGNYQRVGSRTRITVCVKDTARGVYGGAAAGVAFDGSRNQTVTAVVVGDGHTTCRSMLTGYSDHLVVAALSGWPNRTVRQRGRVRQIY